jgi:hypothetical protein
MSKITMRRRSSEFKTRGIPVGSQGEERKHFSATLGDINLFLRGALRATWATLIDSLAMHALDMQWQTFEHLAKSRPSNQHHVGNVGPVDDAQESVPSPSYELVRSTFYPDNLY